MCTPELREVRLARALAVNPSVLLMEEALSALDPLIRFEMQSELLRLQKAVQRTVVFISHDIDPSRLEPRPMARLRRRTNRPLSWQ